MSETFRRFAGPALLATALLAVGYVRTAEGTRHPSPWGYRVWSFGALAYSDILALHEDRGARTHAVPYFADKVEYPVLMGLSMWWPSVFAADRAGYFALTYLVLALCALGALYFIAAIPRANPWAFATSPALIVYSGLNWDLVALFPLVAGIWLWVEGRNRASAAVLAIAVWTKFFPLLVLAVLVLCTLRRFRIAVEMVAIALSVTVAVNLPFALFARDNWLWFFRYNQIRELEPSLYLLFGADQRGFVPTANLISAAATLAAFLTLAVLELRTRRLDALRASCALVCLFFLANKVYSPQYWLWVMALVALAALPGWLVATASGAALADFVVSFSRLHLQFDRAWAQAAWFDQHVFWPTVALRYVVLAACAAWAFGHSLRPAEAR